MRTSFTLLELLIIVAIIVGSMTLLISMIKPMEFLKNTREAIRLNNIQRIDNLISIIKKDNPRFNELDYASSNVVYISLPDNSATCTSWLNKLPTLPSNWSYRCSANPQNVDGTGWIPIPFKDNPLINIINLPVDPINNPPYYYSFVVGDGYKLTAKLETLNGLMTSAQDNGVEPTLYEIGSNLKLPTPHSGLVLYLSFDEGTGTIAYDSSAFGNNGFLLDGSNINDDGNTPPQWVGGKIGKALNFDGIDDYVKILKNIDYSRNAFTFLAWIKIENIDCEKTVIASKDSFVLDIFKIQPQQPCNRIRLRAKVIDFPPPWVSTFSSDTITTNTWYFVGGSYNGKNLKVYLNDKSDSANYPGSLSNNIGTTTIGVQNDIIAGFFSGIIDEVRIYNRSLSSEEINLIYKLTQ